MSRWQVRRPHGRAIRLKRCLDRRPIGQPPLDRWAIPDWPAPLDPHLPPPPPMVVLATCVAFGRGIPGVVGSVLRELRRAMTALDAPIKSGHDEWRVLSSHRLAVSVVQYSCLRPVEIRSPTGAEIDAGLADPAIPRPAAPMCHPRTGWAPMRHPHVGWAVSIPSWPDRGSCSRRGTGPDQGSWICRPGARRRPSG